MLPTQRAATWSESCPLPAAQPEVSCLTAEAAIGLSAATHCLTFLGRSTRMPSTLILFPPHPLFPQIVNKEDFFPWTWVCLQVLYMPAPLQHSQWLENEGQWWRKRIEWRPSPSPQGTSLCRGKSSRFFHPPEWDLSVLWSLSYPNDGLVPPVVLLSVVLKI